MRGVKRLRGERGSVLFIVMVLSMALAFGVTVLLHQGQVEARATSVRLGSVRALYDAYGELELAKTVINEADYDASGHNLAVQAALGQPDRRIAGTDVVVEPLTGPSGTWYTLTVSRPYEGVYERVVSLAFREIDFFSSYNLFVSDDPAGISGSPVGAIHTNEQIQFYFPGGVYRHSVTAVGGRAYKSGATADNTAILGPFNDAVGRIDIDYEGSDRYSLTFIESNVEAMFRFDATLDTKLQFYPSSGAQWVHVERWSKPEIRTSTYQHLLGYDAVNPHEEEYTYVERVSTGFETRTRDVQVFDHYETVQDEVQTPIYVDDVRTVSVPVYRTDTGTKWVPVYRYDTLYKTETKMVWISVDGSSGGTTVGGDDGSLGYWAPQPTFRIRRAPHR